MTKAYIIAEIDIRDLVGFEEYRVAVAPMIADFGGRYIVRGGALTTLEGDPLTSRVVVLEFPTVDAAQAFWHSDDYQPVAAIRRRTSNSRIYMVEGTPS